MLIALLVPVALAGDHPLYARALGLIDDHYLDPSRVDRVAMFVEAGRQLESRVEWLMVDEDGGTLKLRDGAGSWHAEVSLRSDDELPYALARLEDAVVQAGMPLGPEVDVRVEILRGAVKTLDRHSTILFADGLERFDERLSGTLSGVGATISLDDRGIYVRELVRGGPAERAGLEAGDRLLRIDGLSTVGMVPADATLRIRGLAGTPVTLLVERAGATRELTIRREEIAIRNVTASRGPQDVGVLEIEHFSEQTRAWLADGLGELGEMGVLPNGLVLDVRGNTGGSLLQSAQAADAFLQSGLIVTTAGRDGGPVPSLVPRIEARAETPPYAMPIAVLMDHATASGSEILAGALARLDRALLVGTTSFGKGSVQKVYQLDTDIKLKLTVARWLLDGGNSVTEVGLQPDVALEEVRFSEDGVWWPSPARERRRLPPGTPIVRYAATDGREAELEIAAALLHAADGSTRGALLEAASAAAARLAAEEDARLVDAFRARGVEWAAPPPGTPAPEGADVELRLGFSEPPLAGRPTEVRATVVNRGGPLWRAAIRLESVNPLWDDLVLPIGYVPAGATLTGVATVTPSLGGPVRTDRVVATLEAEGLDGVPVGTRDVSVAGAPPPPLAVALRARPGDGGRLRVVLDVENRGDRALTGARARFEFPEAAGVELVQAETDPIVLPAKGSARVTLELRVAETWTAPTIPLSLVVEADGFDRVGRYPVELPRTGGPVRVEPPVVHVQAPPAVLPPGQATLSLRAVDDRALDHVVVFAGAETMNRTRAAPFVEHKRDKVAWRPARGRRVDVQVAVPVQPGANHYVVVAEDATGLRTVRDVYVLGDDGAAVADPE